MKERYVYLRFNGRPKGKEQKKLKQRIKARGEAKKSKEGALLQI